MTLPLERFVKVNRLFIPVLSLFQKTAKTEKNKQKLKNKNKNKKQKQPNKKKTNNKKYKISIFMHILQLYIWGNLRVFYESGHIDIYESNVEFNGRF